MVFLKFVFITLTFMGTLLPSSHLFAQDTWQLDLISDRNTARLNLRLAYLKLTHVLPRLPSRDFVSFEEFIRVIAKHEQDARQAKRLFAPTLGELKQFPEFKIEVAEKSTRSFAYLTPDEVLQELFRELEFWKENLSSRDLPLLEVRERIALAYCKALGENSVQKHLKLPENAKLREQLLHPIATLLKADRDWALRAKLLDPVLNLHPNAIFGLFEGTTFETDLLGMMFSDPKYSIQEKLLKHFQRKIGKTDHPCFPEFINNFRKILNQLIKEDAKREIRQLANKILIDLMPLQDKALDGEEQVLLAAPAATSSPSDTKRIKKSTRVIEKPADLLAKVQHLQRKVLATQLEVSLERQIDMVLDPQNINKEMILPLVQEIIFTPKADLYIQLLAIDILFYYPEEMFPILNKILIEGISEDLKLKVLLTIGQDLPQELVSSVTKVVQDPSAAYSETIRRTAVKTLSGIKDSFLVAQIHDALFQVAGTDPSPTVRAETLETLSTLEGKANLDAIEALAVKDQSPVVQWKGVEILERFSKHNRAMELMKFLGKDDALTGIRVRNAEALGRSALTTSQISEEVEARLGVELSQETSTFGTANQFSLTFSDRMLGKPWKADEIVGALETSYIDTFKTSPRVAKEWMVRNRDALEQIDHLHLGQGPSFNINLRIILRQALREATRRY